MKRRVTGVGGQVLLPCAPSHSLPLSGVWSCIWEIGVITLPAKNHEAADWGGTWGTRALDLWQPSSPARSSAALVVQARRPCLLRCSPCTASLLDHALTAARPSPAAPSSAPSCSTTCWRSTCCRWSPPVPATGPCCATWAGPRCAPRPRTAPCRCAAGWVGGAARLEWGLAQLGERASAGV